MPQDHPSDQPPGGNRRRRFPRRFGRYILEKTLSRGGMGEVFLAIVRHLNQRCVIKTIRGDLTGEEEFVGRFADEAKILVRAGHDNIIRYFDAGRVANDYYIAMEYVHGRDLGDVLDRAYERGEPMPPDIGLFVTANLLHGLHYAHELKDEHGRRMGLVHRDISPQNVLIGFDGSVKLIDFGLARTDILPNRTQGALAVGKYGYMSPEQARHEPLDGRADIYSTGVMLFEVFTGDRLVDEQDQSTLWQRVLNPRHRNPRSVLPSLTKDIDNLVMRAVAVRPDDRFPSARAMAAEVERLRGGTSHRRALQDYLRFLYPRVDFSAPPLPDLSDLGGMGGVEQSLIIATSREGAKSVFGRGELPIEGTMQLNAAEIRAQIEERRKKSKQPRPSPAPPPAPRPPNRQGPSNTVARFTIADDEATAFIRKPEQGPTDQQAYAASPGERRWVERAQPDQVPTDQQAYAANPGERRWVERAQPTDLEPTRAQAAPPAPSLNQRAGLGDATDRDDEERTVMMTAPPRGLVLETPLPVPESFVPNALEKLFSSDTTANEDTDVERESPIAAAAASARRSQKNRGQPVPPQGPGWPGHAPPPHDGLDLEATHRLSAHDLDTPIESPSIVHHDPSQGPSMSPSVELLRARAVRERVSGPAGERRPGAVPSERILGPPPLDPTGNAGTSLSTRRPYLVLGLGLGLMAGVVVLALFLVR